VFSGLLILLGLSGLPEDVQRWNSWLSQFDSNTWRWVFVLVGVFLFLGLSFLTRSSQAVPAREFVPHTHPDPPRLPMPNIVKHRLTITDEIPARLRTEIEQEEWRQVPYSLLVLRAKVRITNNTDDPARLGGLLFESAEGVPVVDENLRGKLDALWPPAPPPSGVLNGHDSVSGWRVCTFRAQPLGGTPAYKIGIADELENIYWASMPAKPPAQYGGSDL
jgi:hypothetical protein